MRSMPLVSVLWWSVFAFGSPLNSQGSPTIHVDLTLARQGLQVFDTTRPSSERETALAEYLEAPLMAIAFERYSTTRRPPEQRVGRAQYEQFVKKLWRGREGEEKHPRLRQIIPQYRWGMSRLDAVKNDITLVEREIDDWLKQAMTRIPFGTPAAEPGDKPLELIFLFDPGGSYPWVYETEKARYIYFDVLQLRGLTDDERGHAIDPLTFQGFLIHELYHQFQVDHGPELTKADWLVRSAVSEGGAMIVGNNAFSREGERLFADEPVKLSGVALKEWQTEMPRVCERIAAFAELWQRWQKAEPAEAEFFATISSEGWVAAPANGYLFGDVYRIGAQMLLDIKARFGLQAVYEVLGDSSLLFERWRRSSRCE